MNMLAASSTLTARRTLLATALTAALAAPAFASSSGLVISQVYGGGGSTSATSTETYKYDFIELHNGGNVAIPLGGKSVQYGGALSTATTFSGVLALPNVTLQPGQFFLVRVGGAGINGADLTGDASTTSFSMGANAGRVALSAGTTALPSGATPGNNASVIDMVSYGGATKVNPTEGAVAGATDVTTAAIRTPLCSDTDDNATDFTIGTPVPRALASTPVQCGGTNAPIIPTCPSSVSIDPAGTGSFTLTATDSDDAVSSIALASAPAGISLSNVVAAGAAGGTASASLDVAANASAGNTDVVVNFGNARAQTASCTVKVRVAGTANIMQIQGSGAASPLVDTLQWTTGVVTAKVASGFFIQDPNGDGDPATSDGIYVFSSNYVNSVNVGDLVQVKGTVQEYAPVAGGKSVTEMSFVSGVSVISTGNSIAPTNLGDLPDTNLDQYQGMLVHFNNPLYISQSDYLGSRGELSLSSGARLEQPTNRYPFGSAEYTALVAANAKNLIVLDDGLFVTPPVIPYLDAQHTRRAGDVITSLTGVLDYGTYGGSGSGYKVQPTEAPVFSAANPRPAEPVLAAGNVRVASANVLNFFTEFTDKTDVWGGTTTGCYIGSGTAVANCRGADNIQEFMRQRDKVVAALLAVDADAYGLMEVQNNGEKTVNYLVQALNDALGYNAYAAVPVAGSDAVDPNVRTTGTDAIRVAIIYKPARLTLVGGALSDPDGVNNRAPVAATFKAANGGKFSLVVNHFRAKGSCKSTAADNEKDFGEGCWNQTRINQANRLTSYFLPLVKSTAASDSVLVVGDLNAYAKEDPILALEAAGLQNQIERFIRPREMPHSYVFGHTAGYLDHALASAALAPQVVDVAEFHNNADEPEVLDYNLDDGRLQDFYEASPYRASDHDPVVVSLNLAATFTEVTGSFSVARGGVVQNPVTKKYSGSVTIKNTSGAPITGPIQFELANLSAGVTLLNASGTHNGNPYITLNNASIAPGASVTFTTSYDNPSKVLINYSPMLYSGTF